MQIIAKIGHTEFLLPSIETAHQLLVILGSATQVEKIWFRTKEFTGHVITDARRADDIQFSLENLEWATREKVNALTDAENREAEERRTKDAADLLEGRAPL